MQADDFLSRSRAALMPLADWTVVAIAVALPWSTSATAVLIVVWLVVVVPTFDAAIIRASFARSAGEKSAGELPVLLWALAVLGMLWADATWNERLVGAAGFTKLLAIPLLLAQFYRSGAGRRVLLGFLASATALLVLSWALVVLPGLPWRGRSLGVPVKDYLTQSEIFVVCAMVILYFALRQLLQSNPIGGRWMAPLTRLAAARLSTLSPHSGERVDRRLAILLLTMAVMFVTSVGYVATARTSITVFAALLVVFGTRHFGWKGMLASLAVLSLIGCLLWSSSGYFRSQILGTVEGAEGGGTNYISISTALRLEIWEKSIELIAQAPLIGHGTGTIPHVLHLTAPEQPAAGAAAINPHSQIFVVGIQMGLLGIAVLLAMWISHLVLFRDGGSIGWIGTVIVVQNIVSSMFNSHLSDFTQGWLYVLGTGVVGGMALKQRAGEGASLKPALHQRNQRFSDSISGGPKSTGAN
jgi:O-antigen ligase